MHRVVTLLIIALICGACSGGKTIATVDGEKISSGDLIEKMRMERNLYDPTLLSDQGTFDEFRHQALNALIQETVLLREARRRGIDVSGKRTKAIPEIMVGDPNHIDRNVLAEHGIDPKRWRKAQHKRTVIRELIDKEVMEKIPVTDEEIDSYYNKHIPDFRENARFHARQILVDKKEAAERIHARLMKGEEFQVLAREFSVSPDASRGGDLGFFDAKAYPEIFSEVCQQLNPGEISSVKTTPYGYQIFQLIAKRPPRQRSLDEVRDSIRRNLRENSAEEVFAPWLEDLMNKAKISVNEAALKEVKLNG